MPTPPSSAETLLTFPCAFPIKAMGRCDAGFAQAVVAVVQRHVPDFDAATAEMRASSGGKYLSVTCTVIATSKAQLDLIYRDLSTHPMVVMVL